MEEFVPKLPGVALLLWGWVSLLAVAWGWSLCLGASVPPLVCRVAPPWPVVTPGFQKSQMSDPEQRVWFGFFPWRALSLPFTSTSWTGCV